MDLVTFAKDLIPFQTLGFNITARTRSGGPSMGGREQIVSSGNALWTATGTVRIRTPAMVREWRRMLWALEGRANALLIGPCDCRNGGFVPPGAPRISVPHDDTTPFDDGTMYSQGGLSPTVVDNIGVAGTNIVNIYPLSGVNILPGTYIGFDNRLYGIMSVVKMGFFLQLTLKPRLRDNVTTSSVVYLCDARAQMRLTDDSVGALELQLGRFGDVSLDLIEVYGG